MEFSFEKCPSKIFQRICKYLNNEEIANLCYLSKAMNDRVKKDSRSKSQIILSIDQHFLINLSANDSKAIDFWKFVSSTKINEVFFQDVAGDDKVVVEQFNILLERLPHLRYVSFKSEFLRLVDMYELVYTIITNTKCKHLTVDGYWDEENDDFNATAYANSFTENLQDGLTSSVKHLHLLYVDDESKPITSTNDGLHPAILDWFRPMMNSLECLELIRDDGFLCMNDILRIMIDLDFNLKDLILGFNIDGIEMDVFQAFTKKYSSKLERLTIDAIGEFEFNKYLQQIGRNLFSLEKLSLSINSTDIIVKCEDFTALHNLRHLSLSCVFDASIIKVLARDCPNLVVLTLQKLGNGIDKFKPLKIKHLHPIFSNLKHLEMLTAMNALPSFDYSKSPNNEDLFLCEEEYVDVHIGYLRELRRIDLRNFEYSEKISLANLSTIPRLYCVVYDIDDFLFAETENLYSELLALLKSCAELGGICLIKTFQTPWSVKGQFNYLFTECKDELMETYPLVRFNNDVVTKRAPVSNIESDDD